MTSGFAPAAGDLKLEVHLASRTTRGHARSRASRSPRRRVPRLRSLV
jgi:hypothetical protein